jgi:hypothetical protein
MKTTKHTKTSLLAACAVVLLAGGCGDDAKNSAIDNSIYLANVTNSNAQRVTAGDEDIIFPIQVRMAKPAEMQTTVAVGVQESVLEVYNQKQGATYVMLPTEFYELTDANAVIEAGSSIASAVGVKIKPLSTELNKSGLIYAVPVSIQSVAGSSVPVLEASSYFIYLVAPTPYADIPVLTQGRGMRMMINDGPITVTNYTLEFLVKIDNLRSGANNQILFNANNGTNDNDLIFSRFAADASGTNWNKFGVKPGGADNEIAGTTSFENNKWYHIAVVLNAVSGTCSLYVNGTLDVKASVAGRSISIDSGPSARSVRFCGESNNDSYMKSNVRAAELRFWSVVRTEAQIRDNMYGVNPQAPGLEAYWRMNEGQGDSIADATGHGHHAIIFGTPVWEINQKVEVGK